MKKRISIISVVILSLAVIAAGVFYFALPRVYPVSTVIVSEDGSGETVVGYGTIKEKKRSGYYIDLPAKIKSVFVEVGESVTKGQPLIELDLEATELYLKMTVAGLIRYDPETDALSIGGAAGTMDAASLRRMLTELSEIPPILYANYDCVITAVNAQEGEFSTPYEPVVVMSDTSGYLAVISMAETELSRVEVGCPAWITGAAFEERFPAEVTEIAPRGSAAAAGGTTGSSMFDVTLTIEGGTDILKPNQSARCEIAAVSENRSVRLPYDAVFSDGERDFVYVVENGFAVRREITVAATDAESITVTDGVRTGEAVVANYTEVPENGCQVRQLDEDPS